METIQEVM